MTELRTVGIVGVGRMGGAIARRLDGHVRVVGWDVRPVDGVPIEMVATPAELPKACDVVLLTLPSPVETKALFADGGFRRAFGASDTLVLDMSTSDPASLRALADGLERGAERLMDAPVLGRPERCGSWTIPLGGDAAHVPRARAALDRVAARVEHVGPLGAGHTVKLLNNLMFAAINVVTAEAIAACERLGVEPSTFVDVVGNSAAATVSPLFRDLAPRMIGEADGTVFTVGLLAKDLQLAARMCEDVAAPLASARASQTVLSQALRLGLAEHDSAAIVEVYREATR